MLTFICYPKCGTCQKARAVLESYLIEYEDRDIKTDNPSYDELRNWLLLSKLPVKKFFNTSGLLYKSLNLKNKLSEMSEDECLKLLATDGMLVKRPLLVDDDDILVGFNNDEWESVLKERTSVPTAVTIDVTSNDISFPFQWGFRSKLGLKFAQITLMDDRLVIHKPTAADAAYTRPCKVGDNSYIRTFGLFDIKVPYQLLEVLGIHNGGKADLTLEDNCISIRKHPDEPTAPEQKPPEHPDPILAFCCICGKFHYTNVFTRIMSKYICNNCIEAVKAL